MESPGFVEEIEFEELELCGVVGRGAFGVVSQAKWRGIDVAVKLIETESEKKAFITELKQLSRVSHPNIVKLYGACTKTPVCLVMEYAEGGSLYNVLHGSGYQPDYTFTHSMSWALQCAKGVEYLHSMKPKPLIHRDLKPPNLLLVLGGTVLKICDFGTACDAHTHMTNNKGSAAWMAPEVFEGNNYSEKCDVFSFGIILWEVLTRRKPFDEIGGPAFRIMWAVHNGTRPPLIKNCPKPLELLMTKSWSSNPVERPSMAEVVRIMTHLSQFLCGPVEPLVYPDRKASDGPSPTRQQPAHKSSVYDTPPMTNPTQLTSPEMRANTIRDTVREAFGMSEPVDPIIPATPRAQPVVVEEEPAMRTSAPASLAASRESLLDSRSRSSTPSIDVVLKRYSADLTKVEEMDLLSQGSINSQQSTPMRGHRRSSSLSTACMTSNYGNTKLSPTMPVRGHRRTGSYGNSPSTAPITLPSQRPSSPAITAASGGQNIPHVNTAPGSLMDNKMQSPPEVTRMQNWVPGSLVNIQSHIPFLQGSNDAEKLAFIALGHQLQPLSPCPTSPESMAIFDQHCKYATEYMKLQMEIDILTEKKFELMKEKEQSNRDQEDSEQIIKEYGDLSSESESLKLLYDNLKKQLEMIRKQQPSQQIAGV